MKINLVIMGIIIMVVGLTITGGAYATIQGINAKISECNTADGQFKMLYDPDYVDECENAEDMGFVYNMICLGGIPIIIIGILIIIVGILSKHPQQYQQPYQPPPPQYPPQQPPQYPPQPPPQQHPPPQQPPPQYPPQQPPQYPPQ